MDINLRDINPDLQEMVVAVKLNYNIATNTKAVEFCTLNYLSKVQEIQQLKSQLSEAQIANKNFRYKLNHLKDLFKWIMID